MSFLIPGVIYYYDFSTAPTEHVSFKEVNIVTDFDRMAFVVEQKF